MKKILFVTFMFFAMFFIVSCSGDDEISNALGGSCTIEGAETCSADSSQILICQNSSWQAKKTCNLNFGQYCRQTAAGSFSCTDTENGSNDSTDNENTDTESDTETPDSNPETPDSTDSEPSDNEPADDNEPVDDSDSTDDGDTQPSDNDNDTDTGEPEPEEDPIPAPGDCVSIMDCMGECELDANGNLVDSKCPENCYNNGTIDGKAQYQDWQNCNESNNCEYYYDCLWEKCRNEEAVCGLAGDTVNYKIPYGKANISGTFTYLHSSDETVYSNHTIENGFITGSFGRTNVNLIDTNATPFAFASLENESSSQYIMLTQQHNTSTTAPIIQMLVSATTNGTYVFGLGDFNVEKVRMFILDVENNSLNCTHAFGYGAVTISNISYDLGETTISLNGDIDLYSLKAMPYYGGDISDDTNAENKLFTACPAK
jgi:hypothetical protein